MIDCCVTTEVIRMFIGEMGFWVWGCNKTVTGTGKGGGRGNQNRKSNMKTTLMNAYTFMYTCIY